MAADWKAFTASQIGSMKQDGPLVPLNPSTLAIVFVKAVTPLFSSTPPTGKTLVLKLRDLFQPHTISPYVEFISKFITLRAQLIETKISKQPTFLIGTYLLASLLEFYNSVQPGFSSSTLYGPKNFAVNPYLLSFATNGIVKRLHKPETRTVRSAPVNQTFNGPPAVFSDENLEISEKVQENSDKLASIEKLLGNIASKLNSVVDPQQIQRTEINSTSNQPVSKPLNSNEETSQSSEVSPLSNSSDSEATANPSQVVKDNKTEETFNKTLEIEDTLGNDPIDPITAALEDDPLASLHDGETTYNDIGAKKQNRLSRPGKKYNKTQQPQGGGFAIPSDIGPGILKKSRTVATSKPGNSIVINNKDVSTLRPENSIDDQSTQASKSKIAVKPNGRRPPSRSRSKASKLNRKSTMNGDSMEENVNVFEVIESDKNLAAQQEAEQQAAGRVKYKDHPDYKKYFRMLKLGVPRAQIEPKLRAANVDPSFLDTPDAFVS